jgi:hypothetical protein
LYTQTLHQNILFLFGLFQLFVTSSTPQYVETNDTTLLSYHQTTWIAMPSATVDFYVIVPMQQFLISFQVRACNLACDLHAQ